MADVQTLFDYIEKFKILIEEDSQFYTNKYGIVKGNVQKEAILGILSELKGNPFTSYIMRVIKEDYAIGSLFDMLPKVSLFENLYKYYNSRYGIEIDEWDEKTVRRV